MSSKKDLLDQLFVATLTELLKRIEDGTASPADLSVARALLKDNNISAISKDMPAIRSLAESLPFDPDDE